MKGVGQLGTVINLIKFSRENPRVNLVKGISLSVVDYSYVAMEDKSMVESMLYTLTPEVAFSPSVARAQ